MATDQENYEALREAVTAHCTDAEGQIVTKFIVIAEISDLEGFRWLSHRAGTMGDELPQMWDVLGMLHSGVVQTEEQVRDYTRNHLDEEED